MNSQTETISEEILVQLHEKGISKEAALTQIDTFKKGIPFTQLLRPCTIGDGIENIDKELEEYINIYKQESASRNVIKFVPASGAASRMFKELLSIVGTQEEVTRNDLIDNDSKEAKTFLDFIDNISKFAFTDELTRLMEKDAIDLCSLLNEERYKSIADYTLGPIGLNYANLPKGIIQFHKYGNKSRTAFEEHLVEACEYSKDDQGISRLHFTVSPEHMETVKGLIQSTIDKYQKDGTKIEINYSIQKPSTDTLAVDMNNEPLVDINGKVVLRPGGHGALIENLNELNCDIAFIKNIDNVVPDRLKSLTYQYKKALGGYLIVLQQMAFEYLIEIDEGYADNEFIENLSKFLINNLKIQISQDFNDYSKEDKLEYLRGKLDRPIRICGVVKNVGEPGGGPFWITDKDGNVSKQIVESAQVDLNSEEQKTIWESSTHFNPVDLVCGLKNYKGEKFDLKKYINPDMGFISQKSKDGVDLKALELPGLWNGAMADWNTLFVEVPLITFNPVKIILDLLRPEHQPQEINQ